MKISESEDYWPLVAAHTNARNSNGAPWSVQLQVAALVGDHGITAAVARFTPDAPSAWTIVAVTEDGRLIRVHMDFDAERYDREAEQSTFRQHHSIAPTVHAAWVRRLSHVVRLDIRKVQTRSDAFGSPSRDHFDFGDVHLTFDDGAEIDVDIDQPAMYKPDDRADADAFLAAVRAHTEL